MKLFVPILVGYVVMACFFLVFSIPDPGYEKLWVLSALVAPIIYLSPVILGAVFMWLWERIRR